MAPNGWTTMTGITVKGGYIVCGAAPEVESNPTSSESSLMGDGTASTSEDFPITKTSTTSATEGISTTLGSHSEHFGSINRTLPPPQSKILLKPLDHSPKPTRTSRTNRRYRPRRGDYVSTTSPGAQKGRFPGQLLPRTNIPRTSGDVTDASTLLRLFPDVLQNKSTAEIEKWVETCKEYELKGYNQEEPPGMPDRGQRMRDETESGASFMGGQGNKQHPAAIQHMPTAEHRQNHNGRDDFQDTNNDDDISYGPGMSSQRPN